MPLRLSLFLFIAVCINVSAQVYEVSSGKVSFHSNAPKELIHASSSQLRGLINRDKKQFAFKVAIASFMGFNSMLQREHFNENYMETSTYPDAAYKGKVIEDVDLARDGYYIVRAKGKLKIHGLEQERIIYARIKVSKGSINITANFEVPLADHGIKIPRVVYDKLATSINVTVNAMLIAK